MTFLPVCNIETKQIMWSCFKNGEQLKHNDEPQVQDSVFLAGMFADRYADSVKKVTF